jgi:murein L,D-transpeptidase YcbB/YkuD
MYPGSSYVAVKLVCLCISARLLNKRKSPDNAGTAFVKLGYMKKLFVPLILCCSLLTACGQTSPKDGDDDSSTAKESKNLSKRDISITKANAYNDLFIDSLAVQQYLKANKVPDSIARRVISFYNTRNYQYAWFSSNGLTEQALGFWNLHDYYTTYEKDSSLTDKKLMKKMDALIATDNLSVSASNKDYQSTELTLTRHFIEYTLKNYEKGYVKRKEMERFIPRKKEDPMALADSIINKKHKDNKYFEDVNLKYGRLKDALAQYYTIAKNGGWPTITAAKKSYSKGTTDPVVAQLKRRLKISGDLAGNDTSAVFNDTLANAVKSFQLRHGYKADGIVTAQLIKDMNVPATKRVQQILMNMERMRWMPNEPNGDLIVVNIPEFMLHVTENNKKIFDMVVVVGKEGHNTMMFTGDLNQVVFSPYWNVPPSIVKNEILPKMNSNPGYLASQNMEVVGNADGLPDIRQRPGGDNALGKVKFLFPNSFNIYFHDTPSKNLFTRDKRALSHGCIRLAEPEKMANYLLRKQPEWTPERIRSAMDAGTEKFVKLKDPVPVFISYYTAWVDDSGKANFRDDIYSHDTTLAKKVFTAAY